MKNWLMPDYMFPTYDAVTPEFLKSIGVRAMLADIDNTLAPYEQAEPDERLRGWLAALADAGISITFVSNNGRERVELFNRTLDLPAYYKSGKPFGKNLRRAMTAMGSDKTSTVMLGDQLLTDALAGKHLGLRAIIVPPIRDRRDAFTRFKRALERPFVRRYKKKNGVEW